MTAPVGCALIYDRLQRFRDEDDRLRIDAVLGMPGAADRVAAQRRANFIAAGGEIG